MDIGRVNGMELWSDRLKAAKAARTAQAVGSLVASGGAADPAGVRRGAGRSADPAGIASASSSGAGAAPADVPGAADASADPAGVSGSSRSTGASADPAGLSSRRAEGHREDREVGEHDGDDDRAEGHGAREAEVHLSHLEVSMGSPGEVADPAGIARATATRGTAAYRRVDGATRSAAASPGLSVAA